ncbi:histidine--tRNA ligase [Buchnera aphidicola (Pemphigus obesinymphae)]|uniref:histidine--tRNA ligase n=1 Tax=Buchnera aphidicola TaxID=9 RepID=UPI0022370076|nr:histidine--tRNA ligase [Buchnera aphidicola]MCW5196697.1 histidine--tRNA ligase [Buchnera aphidicola (Pemphigus obesinymphae)]
MNIKNESIRGMHDYLPKEIMIWNHVETILKKILFSYCYNEIRLPILEYATLFNNTIGNTTDIITKEMYSFEDRNKKKITLRPEGTVSCARANIQHKLLNNKEQKLWYLGPMFRYERPQKGRYRQFYQMGVEVFGLKGPDIEMELILLTSRFWKKLGIDKYLILEINSIGSINIRHKYKKDLINFLKKNKSQLDDDSKKRLDTNPLRILDSKNPSIQILLKNGPKLYHYLDENSSIFFKKLCCFMSDIGIPYTINNNLIRGLDYYNDTVFEWKTNKLGSQNTICAGGRYDKLIEQLGGPKVPAVGFAVGMDRLILLIKEVTSLILPFSIDVYILIFDDSFKLDAIKLSEFIRNQLPALKIMTNFHEINITKQFRLANKHNSRVALLLGPKEKEKKSVLMKDLTNQTQKIVLRTELINELSFLL